MLGPYIDTDAHSGVIFAETESREELQKILEYYGYVMNAPRSGSSHYTFRKSGKNPITIPKHEPIKKVYVEMGRDIVEEEMLYEDN